MIGHIPRALALVALAAVILVPGVRAARVAVLVVPSAELAGLSDRGARGLLVPGAGSTVTREGALSSLVRGRVVSSLLGGKAAGPPLIALARTAGPVTIYVSLPPPGRTHNTSRYPIAIVGGGYRGILVTDTTRIPGLISIADIAPTALALAAEQRPVIRWRSQDPVAVSHALARLDERLRRSHDTRTAATITLVAATLVLAALGLVLQSRALARAGLLAIPSALALAFLLSAAGISRPGPATLLFAAGTVLLALFVGARRGLLLPALGAFLVGYLVALAVWPELNSLAILGPHPDGGGRYYGVTNEVETLLLVPVLAAVAVAPAFWLVPLAAVSLVLVGWSRAGADGGGILVVLVALAAFWVLRARIRLTAPRVALAAVAVIALAVALVGVDALTGGSSHVTHAVGGGPGSLVGDLGHRLRISWKGVTATAQAGAAAAATLCALIVIALRPARIAVVDALLIGLVASLLVNDTPTDVLAFGALGAASLGVWALVDVPPTSRSDEGVFLRVSPVQLGRSRRRSARRYRRA